MEISNIIFRDINKVKKLTNELSIKNILKLNMSNNKFLLNDDINTFLYVAKELLETDHKFDFLLSNYYNQLIDKIILKYINERYNLILNENYKSAIKNIIKLSPNALKYLLFSDISIYETGKNHIEKLKLSEIDKKKWLEIFYSSLMANILEQIIFDLNSPSITNNLKALQYEAYQIKIFIKMTGLNSDILDLESEKLILMLKAGGIIEAGSLVSATDPDLYLHIGDFFLKMKLYDEAIEEYNQLINHSDDIKLLIPAFNNKGVAFMGLEKWIDAIKCFDEVLKLDPSQPQAIKNREKCLEKSRK